MIERDVMTNTEQLALDLSGPQGEARFDRMVNSASMTVQGTWYALGTDEKEKDLKIRFTVLAFIIDALEASDQQTKDGVRQALVKRLQFATKAKRELRPSH